MNADQLMTTLDFRHERVSTEIHTLFWKICASDEPLDLDDLHERLRVIEANVESMVKETSEYLEAKE